MRALVVVDMQEDYIGEKSKYKFIDRVSLIDNINNKIEEYIQDDSIIIYVNNKRKDYTSEMVSNLHIKSKFIFEKEKSSCFSSKEFVKFLENNSISKLEIVGIDGNCCVKSTALDSIKYGIKSIVPINYVGVLNFEKFEKTIQKLELNQVAIAN